MRASFSSSFASSAKRTVPGRAAHPTLAPSHLLPALCLSLIALMRPVVIDAQALADQRAPLGSPPPDGYRFVVSPAVSMPLAVGSANRDQIGLDLGLSVSGPDGGAHSTIGVDVAYHYWPVSAEFKRAFNDHLRSETLNTLMLGDGTWGLRVLQFGVHVRVASPAVSSAWPWLRIGVGVYRVDPYTEGYRGDAGFFTVNVPPLERTEHPGTSIAVGTDAIGGRRVRMGVDATYHFVSCSDTYAKNLHVFALGVHGSFGQRRN